MDKIKILPVSLDPVLLKKIYRTLRLLISAIIANHTYLLHK